MIILLLFMMTFSLVSMEETGNVSDMSASYPTYNPQNFFCDDFGVACYYDDLGILWRYDYPSKSYVPIMPTVFYQKILPSEPDQAVMPSEPEPDSSEQDLQMYLRELHEELEKDKKSALHFFNHPNDSWFYRKYSDARHASSIMRLGMSIHQISTTISDNEACKAALIMARHYLDTSLLSNNLSPEEERNACSIVREDILPILHTIESRKQNGLEKVSDVCVDDAVEGGKVEVERVDKNSASDSEDDESEKESAEVVPAGAAAVSVPKEELPENSEATDDVTGPGTPSHGSDSENDESEDESIVPVPAVAAAAPVPKVELPENPEAVDNATRRRTSPKKKQPKIKSISERCKEALKLKETNKKAAFDALCKLDELSYDGKDLFHGAGVASELGDMWVKGIKKGEKLIMKPDIDKALACFDRAHVRGNKDARLIAAKICYEQQRFKEAFDRFAQLYGDDHEKLENKQVARLRNAELFLTGKVAKDEKAAQILFDQVLEEDGLNKTAACYIRHLSDDVLSWFDENITSLCYRKLSISDSMAGRHYRRNFTDGDLDWLYIAGRLYFEGGHEGCSQKDGRAIQRNKKGWIICVDDLDVDFKRTIYPAELIRIAAEAGHTRARWYIALSDRIKLKRFEKYAYLKAVMTENQKAFNDKEISKAVIAFTEAGDLNALCTLYIHMSENGLVHVWKKRFDTCSNLVNLSIHPQDYFTTLPEPYRESLEDMAKKSDGAAVIVAALHIASASQMGDFEKAEEIIDEQIKLLERLYKKHKEIKKILASAYTMRGRVCISRAFVAVESTPEAMEKIRGMVDCAERCYKKAVDFDYDHACMEYGEYLIVKGSAHDRRLYFDKAVKLKGECVLEGLFYLTDDAILKKNCVVAEKYLEQVIDLMHKNGDYRWEYFHKIDQLKIALQKSRKPHDTRSGERSYVESMEDVKKAHICFKMAIELVDKDQFKAVEYIERAMKQHHYDDIVLSVRENRKYREEFTQMLDDHFSHIQDRDLVRRIEDIRIKSKDNSGKTECEDDLLRESLYRKLCPISGLFIRLLNLESIKIDEDRKRELQQIMAQMKSMEEFRDFFLEHTSDSNSHTFIESLKAIVESKKQIYEAEYEKLTGRKCIVTRMIQ